MPDARSSWRAAVARIAAAVAASVLLGLSVATTASAEYAFSLADADAPVGMATDQARDRYWAVVDAPRSRLALYAFASDGTAEGRVTSRDTVTDAQAVAFVDDEAWVGDVGGTREQVTVWNVRSPWPGTEINHAVPYRLTYPDGRHEANAILVDANHRIHVVTIGDAPGIYQAPLDPPVDQPVALTRVAHAPAGVTDAAALVDGRFALRTETALFILDPTSWAVTGEAGLPAGQVGLSLTQSIDESQVLAAAGAGGEVEELPIPGEPPAEPTAASTRAPDPQLPAAEPEDTRTFDQTGTTIALAGALGVAAVAMIVVLIKR